MHLDLLSQRLQAHHHNRPQAGAAVRLALGEVAAGLARLAALGHVYHLAPGPPDPEFHDWPRVYFHLQIAPNGRQVRSTYDLNDLGGEAAGWYPTLEAAQLADGTAHQFHGRGGRALPQTALTVTGGTDVDENRKPVDPVARRAAREALVTALRRSAATSPGDDGGGGAVESD